MKVLLLTDYPAEAEKAQFSRLLHIGRELATAGHEVVVVGSATERPALSAGVSVRMLPYVARGGLHQLIFPFRRDVLRAVMACDAIIVRGYWIGVTALLTAALAGCRKRIYDFHGYVWREQDHTGRRLRAVSTRFMEWLCLDLATHVVAASEGVKAMLESAALRKCEVLENGVDCAEFAVASTGSECDALRASMKLKASRPVMLVVAHAGPWLELPVVVRAAAMAPGIDVVIVGDGPASGAARDEAERLACSNVRFPGLLPRGDVMAMLRGIASGCLCPYDANWLHSAVPGFFASRKVKEYLAAGRALIVSDVPGRGAFLKDGDTCLLYRAGDAADLASKMTILASDAGLRAALEHSAIRCAQDFDWSRCVARSGLLDRIQVEA